ncbi:wax ester/triacylglycerol synthase domain-containing protein [Nocardia inohanensis]|uniref:wax ester/triacylglycerol synthase domain-containing protein n=1 Tax=Nocardia inohanensis TaxID=209246 RepID=UPI0009FC0B07|nr:WS/DGAT domain-containing protein [Nocardia inohanensis]
MNSLAARDASVYWLSARTRNDLFLLYCFADAGQPTDRLRAAIANRVIDIPDLLVHVLETPANIAYPIWAHCEFTAEQFAEHELAEPTWGALTTALEALLNTGIRAEHRAWRLHLFRGITGAPGFAPGEPALVAILQLSHALADGRRAAELARALFSETPPSSSRHAFSRDPHTSEPCRFRLKACRNDGRVAAALELPRLPIRMARTVIRGLAAARAQQELADLTASGAVPPPSPGVVPNLLAGDGKLPTGHSVRMLVRDANELRVPGHTVTVVALTAISLAMQRYLTRRGEPCEDARAQVPMAVAATHGTRNSYRDLSVDLCFGEPDPRARAAAIAADLALRAERAKHPLQEAQSRVTAALPAPILHRDVTHLPIEALPERVSGHTVVSSVHRGPADLTFGGGAVRFTAGFPAIGSVMHLTHGIHGLGDTVTLSLHADPAVVPDLDAYAALLDAALRETATALNRA